MLGITSYATYIPKYRIKVSEISAVWGKRVEDVISSLKVQEKSVASSDEDAATLAISAGNMALKCISLDPKSIGVLFVGSESHPYAVNPTSTTVGEFLGFGNNYLAVDLEFACKAATAGMQAICGLVTSGKAKYGLVIGSDTAQAKPHDILEYTASSAAAALIIGSKKSEIIAEIVDFCSFSSDTPDFWRRDGIEYPSHSGRFTGEPAYYAHVYQASKYLLKKTSMRPETFDYCVFHMPNGKFPRVIAKRLGFAKEQLEPSLTVEDIGNPYSASSLIGLASVLDQASPSKTIFFCSYGSGAGADSFIFKTTKAIKKFNPAKTVKEQIENKQYISYVEYLKKRKII